MMTLKLSLKHNCPFTQETAARFAQMLSRYEASVLLCDAHRTINAKSLLGILSLGYIQQETLEAVIDGPDEQAAAQQRPAKKDKKAAEEKVEEKPVETETESDKTDAQ